MSRAAQPTYGMLSCFVHKSTWNSFLWFYKLITFAWNTCRYVDLKKAKGCRFMFIWRDKTQKHEHLSRLFPAWTFPFRKEIWTTLFSIWMLQKVMFPELLLSINSKSLAKKYTVVFSHAGLQTNMIENYLFEWLQYSVMWTLIVSGNFHDHLTFHHFVQQVYMVF